MRTTLHIDDDVLAAARELARREGKTTGQVVSECARRGLTQAPVVVAEESPAIHGVRPFPRRGTLATHEHVNRLREDDAY